MEGGGVIYTDDVDQGGRTGRCHSLVLESPLKTADLTGTGTFECLITQNDGKDVILFTSKVLRMDLSQNHTSCFWVITGVIVQTILGWKSKYVVHDLNRWRK